MKAVILKNETISDATAQRWVEACKRFGIDYQVVGMLSDTWYEDIKSANGDIFLAAPSAVSEHYKKIYDWKLEQISRQLNKTIYPSYEAISIYENKHDFAIFAQIADIPIPETHIFYNKEEAFNYVKNAKLPIVAKTSLGAAGTGVKIFHHAKDAVSYIKLAFGRGIKRKPRPTMRKAIKHSLIQKALRSPKFFMQRLRYYKTIEADRQKGIVLFQEFIHHDFEWRIVRIGDSFFGHKKLKIGETASGTKAKLYDAPPAKLLDFVEQLCNRLGFGIMAVDLFEREDGTYCVNEMQTQWGQKYEYLMLVDDKRGRFIKKDGQWVFEEGDFNLNRSFDLRLEWILSQQ